MCPKSPRNEGGNRPRSTGTLLTHLVYASDIDGNPRGAISDASKGYRMAGSGKVTRIQYRDEIGDLLSIKATVEASMSKRTHTATMILTTAAVISSATCSCMAGYVCTVAVRVVVRGYELW